MPFVDDRDLIVPKGLQPEFQTDATVTEGSGEQVVTVDGLTVVNEVSININNSGSIAGNDGINELNLDAGEDNEVGVTPASSGSGNDIELTVVAKGY